MADSRPPPPPERVVDDRLDSWKEIAAYMNRDVRTVQRWEKKEGLPVRRHEHDKLSTVYAYREQLDRWLEERAPSKEQLETESPYPTLKELRESDKEVESGTAVTAEEIPKPVWRGTTRTWAVAALFTVGVGLVVWWRISKAHEALPPTETFLTRYLGYEDKPALSPDGNQVAFVWDDAGDGYRHVYVLLIGGGEPLQITRSPANDYAVTWSPDGRRIALLRPKEYGSNVLVIPAFGGQERRLGSIDGHENEEIGVNQGLDWSPDGRFLAVSDKASPEEQAAIFLLDVETGEKQKATSPPRGTGLWDCLPAFSPDGKVLAFVRRGPPNVVHNHRVLVQSVSGGEPRVLAVSAGSVLDLDWSADGLSLIVACRKEGIDLLLRTPVDGGEATRLGIARSARSVSIARNGNRLVYTHHPPGLSYIWRVSGPAAAESTPATRLSMSSALDFWVNLSPDGKRYSFASTAHGVFSLRVCDTDGRNCCDLAERGFRSVWSPDGQKIAYTGDDGQGNYDLYVVEVSGTRPRRLTVNPSSDGPSDWSRDGKWIYFDSDRGGELALWKIPAQGGEASPVTRLPREASPRDIRLSEDARFAYFGKVADRNMISDALSGIWKVPLDGGEETLVLESDGLYRGFWTLWRNRIVYLHREKGSNSIRSFDLETGKVTTVAELAPDPSVVAKGISVSPDGLWVLYSQGPPDTGDLMLVENFR